MIPKDNGKRRKTHRQIALKRKKGFKLLVVSRDEDTLAFFSSCFKTPKYILQSAGEGEEGIKLAKELRPDIVIAEQNLTPLTGYQLCVKMRKDPLFTTTVFLLSVPQKDKEQGTLPPLNEKVDDYLFKPYNEVVVVTQIKTFLRVKMLQDELQHSNSGLSAAITALEEQKLKLEESNRELQAEKQHLKNSLKEISYLMEELEKTTHQQIQLNEQQKKHFENLVHLLATIIELRNPYHKGHSQAVMEIAEFIGERLQLPSDVLEDVKVAALLHEIGKIGIPDNILVKDPTMFTPEEVRIMEQYPLVGESLLKGYPGLENIARIIRHLHENVDGSGYPDGLGSDQIPIGSRIIRIASHFNHLTFNTPESSALFRGVETMMKDADATFDGHILSLLKAYVISIAERRKGRTRQVEVIELKPGMVIAEDLYTSTGIKLIPKRTKLSEAFIQCIVNYSKTDSLQGPIIVSQDE